MTAPRDTLRVMTMNIYARHGRWDAHGPTLRIHDTRLALHQPIHGTMPSDHHAVLTDLSPPAPTTRHIRSHDTTTAAEVADVLTAAIATAPARARPPRRRSGGCR